MDPNQGYWKIRQAIDYFDATSSPDEKIYWGAVIAERFEVLDAWLSKGGFLPNEWANSRKNEAP